MPLFADPSAGQLVDEAGRRFDPRRRLWLAAGPLPDGLGEKLSPRAAVAWLQQRSGRPCPVPVGVVGPREARPEQLETARTLGRDLAELGLVVLCGGRQGVMEAVSAAATEAGGQVVGLLPDEDAGMANPHVTIALATGIGIARNAIIARAAFALVAVGGGYGTISECALALQFGRPVIGLANAPELAGMAPCTTVDAAVEAVAEALLAQG